MAKKAKVNHETRSAPDHDKGATLGQTDPLDAEEELRTAIAQIHVIEKLIDSDPGENLLAEEKMAEHIAWLLFQSRMTLNRFDVSGCVVNEIRRRAA